MSFELPLFIDYLKETKNASESTVSSYRRDLTKLEHYLEERGIADVGNVTATNLNSYVLYLEKQGMSTATVSRSVASMKAFFHFVCRSQQIPEDPTDQIKAPKIEKKAPEILSQEEVIRLLEQPSGSSPKEQRDRAMLELLYATGMRVTELISLKTTDVNPVMNYVICRDCEKERVIPFGSSAKEALEVYIRKGRSSLLRGASSEYLFVNCSGSQMSRQGFWKLIKQYAAKAGIEADITPHTLRHSFGAHLVGNGADLRSVQKMMGHADIASTQRYLDANFEQMRNVYLNTHPRH